MKGTKGWGEIALWGAWRREEGGGRGYKEEGRRGRRYEEEGGDAGVTYYAWIEYIS